MIKVLRNWNEIGEARLHFSREGLPQHASCEKTWDLYHLYRILESLPRKIHLLDLGCVGLSTLKLAYAMGFCNLYGIDLNITWHDRLSQITRMWRKRSLQLPFVLRTMDLHHLGFGEGMFDVVVALSTIEHGVNLPRFLGEAGRVLRKGGILFITTDYWDPGIGVDESFYAFNRSWKIFDKNGVGELLNTATEQGLELLEPQSSLLDCGEKCVAWGGKEFTFVNIVLQKSS